jgi:RNA polymerase sigma-70 factor, ECF subfamily
MPAVAARDAGKILDDGDNHRDGSEAQVDAISREESTVARDPAAELEFREFVAVRSAALQRTAYLLVGNWALAEDLVQTALMKTYLVWRRLEIATVEPYARKVLVNTANSWWRRRWRGERPTAELPDRPVADSAEEWMERDHVWHLIKALPPRQRAVLVLRFYEDLTEAETARLLGVSVGTVKSQSARALNTLRQRLDGAQGVDRVTNGSKT